MSEIKITDLVPQETITKVQELNTEIKSLLSSYTKTAEELAKGVEINVKVVGDIDKLEKLLVEKSKEAAAITQKLNSVIAEQGQVITNTTNTISRQLMEQEKVNKTQRDAYTEHDKVKKLLDHFHDTYEQQARSLVKINTELAENKKAQKDNEKELAAGRMSMERFTAKQAELIAQSRSLSQEKKTLTSIMTAEEKAAQTQEGSYVQLSQQLELLKKAYKDLSEEGRNADFGKELEASIQNLDAHLKDISADMGEFQRNVGNYAIAGQHGVVATDSVIAAMNQEAKTTQDLVDQTKILQDAKLLLNKNDANYENTLAQLNAKIEENKQKLLDVSDIMGKQATSVAEAEAQNKRLSEALKNVDLSSDDASARTAELNAKIDENNRIIADNTVQHTTLKKDLKELVLEIATLTIQYRAMTDEEQNSASGQELKAKIDELTEKAGVLKDAIGDTNAAISNAASDTRGFDQVGGAIQLAIDGFGLATGAAEMFGLSSEDLAEIQTKLQAAIAASNAMQSIQNTLQAQSAVMQGVNLVQTKLRTVAENLHTAAQGKGTIATAALTAAQWAFNAAANANPIGLLVVAIVAAIAAVYGLVKAFQAFFSNSDEAVEKYEEQKQALEDMCDAHDRLTDRMKARGATEAELLEQSLLNKEAEKEAADELFRQASELYDEDEDEYKEALEAKKKADKDFEQAKEDSLNYLLSVIHEAEEEEKKQRYGTYEYKRQLILAELDHQKAIALSLLEQEKITRQIYENLCASLDKAAQLKIKAVNEDEANSKSPKKVGAGGSRSPRTTSPRTSGGSRRGGTSGGGTNPADDLKKAVQAGEDAVINVIEDSLERQRQTELLHYNRELQDLQTKLSKVKTTNVKMREAILNQIEGLRAEHERKMFEIESAGMERRMTAETDFLSLRLEGVKEGSDDELNLRLELLSKQMSAEILAIDKSEHEKEITTEQGEERRAAIVEKYAKLEEQTMEDVSQKHIAAIQKKYSDTQSVSDNALLAEQLALQQNYEKQLKLAGTNEAKRSEIQKKYEEDSARLTEKYAIKTAQASVKMYEDILASDTLSTEDREAIERQLAAAKIAMEKSVSDAAIAENERKVKSDQETLEKRKAAIQQWLQVASDALNGINNLAQAIYDGDIQRIEDEQEAYSEGAQKEQDIIQELVDQKIITEEEGEARKRALEEGTAKKTKEFEEKKAKLKHKQAVWDKANSVAQAAIATALAITQALPNVVLAAIAGAMGALQIATILATPIPKYAKGTDYHSGGPAIVGDGGRPEVVLYGSKAWVTPAKPTLVDIPTGAAVIPDIRTFDDNIGGLIQTPYVLNERPMPKPYDDTAIRRGLSELAYLIRTQTKRQHADAYLAKYEIFKSKI